MANNEKSHMVHMKTGQRIPELGDVVFYRDENRLQHAAIITRTLPSGAVNLYSFARSATATSLAHDGVMQGPEVEQYCYARDIQQ